MSTRAVLTIRRHVCHRAFSSLGSTVDSARQLPARLFTPSSVVPGVFVRHQSVQPLPKLNEEPLPVPSPSSATKDYSPKITGIVDQISGLTLVEVADLSELLKKVLRIPDQAFMGSFGGGAAAPVAAPEEETTTKKKEKTTFTIRLVKYDETKKVPLIKEIKAVVEGLNLVQAKKYVETLPQVVRVDAPKEEAEKLKAQLEAAGGTVELD